MALDAKWTECSIEIQVHANATDEGNDSIHGLQIDDNIRHCSQKQLQVIVISQGTCDMAMGKRGFRKRLAVVNGNVTHEYVLKISNTRYLKTYY